LTTELPSAAPPPGQPRQASRYLLLSAAVVVFAACLVLSFSRIAQQHEAALRDAGANLRVAFLADHEMQQLRHGFDVFALGGESIDRETLRAGHERLLGALYRLTEEPTAGAAADPVQHMIEELTRLQPELETFRPGDRGRHADIAARLDGIGAPLHRMVADVDAIALDEAERSAQRRRLYVEEVLYLLGMLGSGGVFVAMLLRESRRTRRLLAEATDAQVRIEHLAHHDQLTDLPNRWLFKDRLDQALRLAHRAQGMVAIHCVDVDHFKAVNDRYGHVTGDQVLVAVAQRMQACVRQSDTVARLGGDEFAIVQVGVTNGGAVHLAERLLAAFREPLLADGHELKVTVSIGIALYPAHAATADALHRAADTALYRAKESGRDRYHEWQPDDDSFDPPVRYRAAAG
jgi:diguanylate cyclase (GGDEF)-like protein